MQNQSNPDRVNYIYQMLFEMATGNFSFRIPQSSNNDNLSDIVATLNRIASILQLRILQCGHAIPHYTYQGLVQSTFILNSQLNIENFSENIPAMLGLSVKALLGSPFTKVLHPKSAESWNELLRAHAGDKSTLTVQLLFKTADNKIMPSFCTISAFVQCDQVLVCTITTLLQNVLTDSIAASVVYPPRLSESKIVHRVRDYILANLEEQLPSTKRLSRMFGINEFKLKDNFRHYFGTSIYQFYIDEKLKRAHQLIMQTNLSIKTIALMSGYNDYTNFYKAFRKKFSYTPSDLARPVREEKED